LRVLETSLEVRISHRGEHFQIEGPKPQATQALWILQSLYERANKNIDTTLVLLMVQSTPVSRITPLLEEPAPNPKKNKLNSKSFTHPLAPPEPKALLTKRADLKPRSPNQGHYMDAIENSDITFGLGPAGTGKTYLAVAMAVDALERHAVQRIILTRPAVEAGEKLGVLPGDLGQKVDPYLRPLYDALFDLMGFDRVQKAFERQTLEIAPLAFMRGRTLNHAFVILDEAQNTTAEQMKMFLTRLGLGSKAVITGDVSQIDLPKGQLSGLVDAERVLKRVKGISFANFTSHDVVRHPLVARIVDAYDSQKGARS
jgi:phosphate starvation-inducible protein PhoH and related proteins